MCLALGHLIQDKLEFVEYWVSMSTWFVDENHAERGAGKLLTFGLVLTSSMTMTTYIYIQYVYFFIKLCIIRCVYIICICVYIYIYNGAPHVGRTAFRAFGTNGINAGG